MSNQWIWQPSAEAVKKTNVFRFMQRLGFTDREDFLRFSRDNPELFWDAMVKEVDIDWFQPYEKVLDLSEGVEWARWFRNGKLNIAWNCLDRHAGGPAASNVACLWESEDGASRAVTFAELYAASSRLAHGLKSFNLGKGDRVALYMPMT